MKVQNKKNKNDNENDNEEKMVEIVNPNKNMANVSTSFLENILQESTRNFLESDNDEGKNKAEAYYKVIESLLSELNIDQKSILTQQQVIGLIELGSFNHYQMITYGIRCDIIDYYIIDTIVKMISVEGKGRTGLIELFRNIRESLDTELDNKLKSFQLR